MLAIGGLVVLVVVVVGPTSHDAWVCKLGGGEDSESDVDVPKIWRSKDERVGWGSSRGGQDKQTMSSG